MILCKPYPPDIRVEKEVRSLVDAGHDLFVIAESKRGESKREVFGRAHVDRYSPPRPFRRRIDWFYFQLTFKSYFWKNRIRNFTLRNNLEILHVHDLPLVSTTLDVAAEFDLPVVADLHENYPAAKQLWSEGSRNPLVWFGDDFRRWERYEKRILPSVSKIITVVDEASERLADSGILSSSQTTVVMNVEERKWFDSLSSSSGKNDDIIRIVYVGGVRPHRGLDIVIHSLVNLPNKAKVALRIVGAKGQYASELVKLAKDLGVSDKIELVEWIPLEQIPNCIVECDIGIVPHKKHLHTDATIPHKLFQYMLASKPVIVSDCKPLERIIRETKSGLVFSSGNSLNLAETIMKLVENPDLRSELGSNGRKVSANRLSWENEGQKLVLLYDEFT